MMMEQIDQADGATGENVYLYCARCSITFKPKADIVLTEGKAYHKPCYTMKVAAAQSL